MNSPIPIPVVLIHGLWLHASCWDNWVSLFDGSGYQAIAPGWPGEAATAQACRDDPDPSANHGIAEITDHYAAVISDLAAPPIVVGHSFGGLIAERLLGMGLARGGVVIAPAQFRGVRKLPLVQLETAWPVLGHPGKKHQAVPLTQEQFAHGFANAVPRAEADALYDSYGIPSPALPLFEAATANLSPHTAAAVDVQHERGPLLMIAGGMDRTVPAASVHAAYELEQKNPAATEYKVFDERSHSQVVDHNWRDVATCALEFLARNQLGAEPAATTA